MYWRLLFVYSVVTLIIIIVIQAEDSFTVKSFIPFLGFDLRAANQNYAHNCLGLHYCCSRCVPSGKVKKNEMLNVLQNMYK